MASRATIVRNWMNTIQQHVQQRVRRLHPRLFWRYSIQYCIVSFVVIIATLILFALKSYVVDAKVSLFYLLIVLVCAAVAHPGVTFFCGLLSFLCYDFFLVPPVFDLRFASPIQVLDPLAFLAVAVVASTIAGRARQHASEKIAYQKADQLRATLLNLVSHNLRTPLSTIKTVLTTLLATNEIDADSKQLLQYADQEVDHLNRLVANVLELSRLEGHAVQINKQWDALDEVISTVLARWPQEVADGSLSTQIGTMPSLVRFDFELIEAILTNLIDNAFRHGSPPIRVMVTTPTHKSKGEEVWISVEDSGTGVPPEYRARLFDKFFNSQSIGIGLGLAVCKGLVEAHGGRIWAEFAPGKTRFIFTLPLVTYTETED